MGLLREKCQKCLLVFLSIVTKNRVLVLPLAMVSEMLMVLVNLSLVLVATYQLPTPLVLY